MHQLSTMYSVCTPASETMWDHGKILHRWSGWQSLTHSFLPTAVFPASCLWPLSTSPKHFLLTKIIWWLITANIPVNSWKGMLGSMVVGESVQEWGIHGTFLC